MADLSKSELEAVTALLHKEIEAVPAADRPLLLSLVQSYREGISDSYERWLKHAVHIGREEASQGKLVDHAEVIEKWQAKLAAEVDPGVAG